MEMESVYGNIKMTFRKYFSMCACISVCMSAPQSFDASKFFTFFRTGVYDTIKTSNKNHHEK